MATDDVEQNAAELIPGDIRMISGSRDDQTSADVGNMSSFKLPADVGPGGAGGACSGAFTSVITSSSGHITWSSLLDQMRKILAAKRFTQVPQVSSSRRMPLDHEFNITSSDQRPRKMAFIGINYVGMQGELRGCHNDATMMQKIMEQYLGMGEAEVRVLKDDGQNQMPTKKNILDTFAWLVTGAQSGDSLFLHYSGHGGHIADSSGDEHDRRDETLVPVDYLDHGQIVDDEIFKWILKVPKGVTLTVIFDCCHSGSAMDLPFLFCPTEQNMSGEAPPPVMQVNPAFNWKKVFNLGMRLYKMHQTGSSLSQITQSAMKELNADPALKQGLMSAGMSALKRGQQILASSSNRDLDGDQEEPQKKKSSSQGPIRNMAKLGASLLSAANDAGSHDDPIAGFSKFLSKASKFF